MYVCMYVCMYLCIYVSMYLCIYVSMYLCIYVSMNVSMYQCMYVYVCMCVSIYVCIYLCVYVSMYVCMYVCMMARNENGTQTRFGSKKALSISIDTNLSQSISIFIYLRKAAGEWIRWGSEGDQVDDGEGDRQAPPGGMSARLQSEALV